MVNEWRARPLEEICTFLNRGASPSYIDQKGVMVLNQKCVRDGRILFKQARRTDPTVKRLSEERILKSFDVLVNSTGVGTLGRVAQVMTIFEPVTVDSHITIVRADPQKVFPRYLGFVLRNYQPEIEALAEGSTGQTELSRTRLAQLRIALPPSLEQQSIAAVLGSLDDKIDLNRRMNETLEAMARALFKDWFMDFGPTRAKMEGRAPYLAQEIWDLFPDALDDEGKPAGWKIKQLGAAASYLSRGISPSYIERGGILVLNQKCIRDRRVDLSKGRRHDPTRRATSGRLLQKGDILVNSTGVGTLGRVAQIMFLTEDTIVDSHITIVRASKSIASWNYLGMNLSGREAEIESLGEGSTGQTELSRARLAQLEILLPPRPLVAEFDRLTVPLREKTAANENTSRALAQTRDLLLPKLMSGEIRVKDAKEITKSIL